MEPNRAMVVFITFRIGASVPTNPAIANDTTITGKNKRNGILNS